MPKLTDMLNYLAKGSSTATAAKTHVQVAAITAADPVHQLYEAIPIGTTTSTVTKIWVVPLGSHSVTWSGTQAHRIYRQGDIVLVALSPTDLNEGSQMMWGVILGTINTSKFKYVDKNMLPANPRIPDSKHTDYSKFYDEFNKFYGGGNKALNIGFYLPGLEYGAGGDYLVRGENTILRVSEDYVSYRAGGVLFSCGGASESIISSAATKRESLLGGSDAHMIINNDSYSEDLQLVGGTALRDTDPEFRGILTQAGALVNGTRTSIIKPTATLSTIDQRLDGQVHISTVGGFITDKVVSPEAYIHKYRGLVVSDPSLLELDDVDSSEQHVPFARTKNSSYWTKVCKSFEGVDLTGDDWLFDTTGNILGTYHCPYPVEEVKSADGENSEASIAMCGSRMAQCPDGSIVFRDAWGSEIRMSNGDIQLSAARKLVLISSDDTLEIVGGELAINCGGSVNVGSAKRVDLVAKKEVNIAADSAVITADSDVILHGENAVQVNSRKTIALHADSIYGTADDGGITLSSANELTLHATKSASLCSTAAQVVAGSSEVEISANRTNLVSNVTISAGTTTHIMGSRSHGFSSSAGNLTVNGAVVCDKQLVSNDCIIAAASVLANSVMAKTVNPDIGVFKLKKGPKKQAIKSEPAKYGARKVDTDAQHLALYELGEYTLKSLRKSIYAVTKVVTSIVKPIFSRSKGIGRGSTKPATVENDYGMMYIYPGESFWTTSGMVSLSPREIESLAITQTTTTEGAENLFLHIQED